MHFKLNPLAIAVAVLTTSVSTNAMSADVLTNFTINSGGINTMSIGGDGGGSLYNLSHLSGAGETFYYATQYFTPTVTGSYTFGQSSASTDTVMILYTGSFDPNNPSLNAIALNDDINSATPPGVGATDCGGDPDLCPQIDSEALTANTNYHVVITTYNSGDTSITLPIGFYVFGPGAVGVGGQPPATSGFVPLANLVGLGAATILDTAPSGLNVPIAALTALSTTQQTAALKRISPETSRAVLVASRQTLNGALDTVTARLEGVREQGFTVGLADDLMQGKLMVASDGDMAGLLDADGSKRRGFWTKAFGTRGNQDQKHDYAGYDSNTWGMAFGADTLLESNWLVGAALTYAYTAVDMNNFRSGDDTNIKTYQATGYASRDFGKWYLDGMFAYAHQKFDTSRDTSVSGIAKGDFSGHQLAARISAGMPFVLSGAATFTPMLGLEWNRISQDGYTETGAGALSMDVDGETASRVRSVFGAKLSTEKLLANGLNIMPSVHAHWRHDFNNDGIDSTSTFTGGGASFKTPGQDLASDTYNVGASLAFQKSKNFTFTVQVDGEKANGYSAVSGQVVGQWRF